MLWYSYVALLTLYGLALIVFLVYYLTRRAPTGDASMGWALGLFYMAGLAAVIVVALLLREHPTIGWMVLGFPIFFLALPRLKRIRADLYAHFPVFPGSPQLTLLIDNQKDKALHVKLECWFGSANSAQSTLYKVFDYYPQPFEKSSFQLTAYQTLLLAHKAKYLSISIFELEHIKHETNSYIKEIQPCIQHYKEKPAAFRAGTYTILIM